MIGRDSAVANHPALDEYANVNGVKVALGLRLLVYEAIRY